VPYFLRKESKTIRVFLIVSHPRALDHAKQAVADCAYDFVQATKLQGDEEEGSLVPKKVTG
jgi:hypothetical protein